MQVKFVVDSVRVAQLANELATIKGDSLRTYFRNYWKSRAKSPVVVRVDTVTVDSVVTVTDTLEVGMEVSMRESIIGMETCQIALDSNRGGVLNLSHALGVATKSINDLESAKSSIHWREIGSGFATGTIFGFILGQ